MRERTRRPAPHTTLLAAVTCLLAILLATGQVPREDAWIGVGSSVAIIIVQIIETKMGREP